MTTLSISIVTFNSDDDVLATTLEHLVASVHQAVVSGIVSHAELTLVDNASRRRPAASVTQSLQSETAQYLQHHMIYNETNTGFGQAHNQVMLKTACDYHLVLNPDAYLAADYLSAGLNFLASHPGTVMVVPGGTDGQGNPAFLCKRYPGIVVLARRGLRSLLRPLWPSTQADRMTSMALYQYEDKDPADVWAVELASGCCMLARSSGFKAIGGFNPDYLAYFEDFDLSIRIKTEGEITYMPNLHLVHLGGHAARKGLDHILMFVRSAFRFFGTHGWRW